MLMMKGFYSFFIKSHIKTKLTFIYIITFIPLFIITALITNYLSNNTILDNTKQNNMLMLKNVLAELDNSIKDMERISLITFSDKNLQQILEQSFSGYTYEYVQNQKWIEQFFLNLSTIRNEISTIRIVTSSQVLYKYNRSEQPFLAGFDYSNEDWYKLAGQNKGKAIILSTHKLDDVAAQDEMPMNRKLVFSIVRQIISQKNNKPIGYIKIDSSLKTMENIINKYKAKDTDIIVCDAKLNIVYHKDYNLISRNITDTVKIGSLLSQNYGSSIQKINNSEMLVTLLTSDYSDWKILCLTPDYIFKKDSMFIRKFSFVVIFGGIVFSIILSMILSKAFSKPIIMLSNSMKEVEYGKLSVYIEPASDDEIGELTKTFNSMVKRLQDMIEKVYLECINRQEVELKLKKSEIASLLNQIKPHFLYNTLDAIMITAALNKDNAVEKMILTLSTFLRHSIPKESNITILSTELKLIDTYLQIQKFRYRDKIDCSFDISEDVMECKIPTFILQPIVENSIYHGIELTKGKGMVFIRACKNGDSLEITISDNGIGMSENDIGKYNMVFKEDTSSIDPMTPESSHIGLVNVNKRIILLYGHPYGLELIANPMGGLTVLIKLQIMY